MGRAFAVAFRVDASTLIGSGHVMPLRMPWQKQVPGVIS